MQVECSFDEQYRPHYQGGEWESMQLDSVAVLPPSTSTSTLSYTLKADNFDTVSGSHVLAVCNALQYVKGHGRGLATSVDVTWLI